MLFTYIVNNEESAANLLRRLVQEDVDFIFENLDLYGGDEATEEFRQYIEDEKAMAALMLLDEAELIYITPRNGMLMIEVDWIEVGLDDMPDLSN